MSKKNQTNTKDNLLYINNLDDQYQQIMDNIEINQSSDSETTNLLNFRVINTNNSYPNKNTPNNHNNTK